MDKGRDESRRNRFEIDLKLVNGYVSMQVTLMHPAKGTQKRSQSRPHALLGVGVGFKPTIGIVIPRPLVKSMTHRVSDTSKCVVALILVGVHQRLRLGKLLHKRTQAAGLGIPHHTQAHLSGFTPNPAQHRGAVIGIDAASASFIRTAARRVERVEYPIYTPYSNENAASVLLDLLNKDANQ